MTEAKEKTEQVEALLETPDLADALEREQFRRFLDEVPTAIVVSEMRSGERIVYANPEFENLSGRPAAEVEGEPWSAFHGVADGEHTERRLGAAVADSNDWVGTFQIERAGREPTLVDAYSNVIEDDDGTPAFRLAALVEVERGRVQRQEFEQKIREKDEQGKDYEEWIYGEPPQEVSFIRWVGDEVTRVEVMKVDGEKEVRTEREVDVSPSGIVQAQATGSAAPATPVKAQAPTLRRPGEDATGSTLGPQARPPGSTAPRPAPESRRAATLASDSSNHASNVVLSAAAFTFTHRHTRSSASAHSPASGACEGSPSPRPPARSMSATATTGSGPGRCSPTIRSPTGSSGRGPTTSGSTAWPSPLTGSGSTCPRASWQAGAHGTSSTPSRATYSGPWRAVTDRTTRSSVSTALASTSEGATPTTSTWPARRAPRSSHKTHSS